MRILIWGLGSIGRRHARLLNEHFPQHELFALRSSRDSVPVDGVKDLYDWDSVCALNMDWAILALPTALHIDAALKCARAGMHLFIEKPIGSSLEGLDELKVCVKEKNLTSYVAYNLRFHPVIEQLKEYLKDKKTLKVSVRNTSHLQDWRAGVNVFDHYSTSRAQGGGVILECSHEWDYIAYLWGPLSEWTGKIFRDDAVSHDAETRVEAELKAGGLPVQLLLDMASSQLERRLDIHTQEGPVHADLIKGEIIFPDGSVFAQKVERDETYLKQLRCVFEQGSCQNDLQEASAVYEALMAFREEMLCAFS